MTHYHLTQLATRKCTHGNNVVCTCARKQPSVAVAAYLERAKHRLANHVTYNPEYVPEYAKHERYRFVEYPQHGLRFVGNAHDICKSHDDVPSRLVDHKGWYIDSFQQETICGQVYQLPARDGKPQYVPAFSDKCGEGSVIDFHNITDNLSDAVRWSDTMAEHAAESAREYELKDRAEQRIAEITDELKEARNELHALIHELKQTVISANGSVCHVLRSHIASTRESMHKLYKLREKLKENYWEVYNSY
jgi:hypothetical protein